MINQDKWVMKDALLAKGVLDVGWKATQAVTDLVPGCDYALRFASSGAGVIGIKFLTTKGEAFRTYERQVTGAVKGEVEFTAPEYVVDAQVYVIGAGKGRMKITNVEIVDAKYYPLLERPKWQPESYPPLGYKLAFNDEFQGLTLNRKKWHTRLIYSAGTMDHLGDERQRYRDVHMLKGGILSLPARMEEDGTITSAMIRSDATFRYGYFEARVRMPKGIGVFPAMWLNPDVGPDGKLSWPPEIDIFEFVNNGKEDTATMLHSGVVNRSPKTTKLLSAVPTWNNQWTYWRAPFDFTEKFHTIGMEWTPGLVRLFVDGQHIYTRECPWLRDDGTPAPRAHLILNHAIGGSWAGRNGIDEAALNSSLDVAFVRVFQRG